MHHDIQTILDKIMNAFQAQIQEFSPRLIDNLKKKGKRTKEAFLRLLSYKPFSFFEIYLSLPLPSYFTAEGGGWGYNF